MDISTTQNLLNQLKKENVSFEEYVKKAENKFLSVNLKTYWYEILEKTDLSKSDIINRADIGYTYFYDIIRGEKCPSRDKIVRIILATGLNLDDCQNTLKLYDWAELYPKNKRDSALIYAIEHKQSVAALNEMLNSNKMELLQ